MVYHKGIGATSAAAVIFSIILVSNLTLYLASQDRESLYLHSDGEDSLADYASALAGSGVATLLTSEQSLVGSQVFGCSSAMGAIAAKTEALSEVLHSENLTVSVSARVATEGYLADNMSMIAPFNGSVPGDLNVEFIVDSKGSVDWGSVSYVKTEAHLAHLPVHLAGAVSACLESVRAIAESISSDSVTNCTESVAGPLVESASQGPASLVEGEGFEFGLGYAITKGVSCMVDFSVSLTEAGIPGPAGPFILRLQEEGSASFAQPALQPPG